MTDANKGYNDKIDATAQVDAEEWIAARILSYLEEDVEEASAQLGRDILYGVLRRFRPDLFADEPCVRVEYDLNFFGGDYSDVGEFVYLPLSVVGDRQVEDVFTEVTGHGREHIVHYSPDELYTADGEPYEDDNATNA